MFSRQLHFISLRIICPSFLTLIPTFIIELQNRKTKEGFRHKPFAEQFPSSEAALFIYELKGKYTGGVRHTAIDGGNGRLKAKLGIASRRRHAEGPPTDDELAGAVRFYGALPAA